MITKEKVFEEEPKSTQLDPSQYPKTPITLEGRVIDLSTQLITEENEAEVAEVNMYIEPIPITIVRPIAKSVLEVKLIESSSRPQLTGLVIDITPPEQSNPEEQPESPHTTPKPDRGNGIARDTDESLLKLVPTSKEVYQDPDALVLIPYEINRVLHHLTNEQIQAHMEKEEWLEKAAREARLMQLSKPELIKELREHLEKLKKEKEIRRERIDQYRLTNNNIFKPEKSTDIHIHPNAKPVAITVYRNNDKRNLDVHKPFRFGDFGVTEWDKLGAIIREKKKKVVEDLMTSLSKKYDRLKVIPGELGINPTLHTLEQVPFISSVRKRKVQELEPEIRIPGLECNRSLPEGF
ncbi:hypothetical protein Tco_0633243 [Tanacetum coccineum]